MIQSTLHCEPRRDQHLHCARRKRERAQVYRDPLKPTSIAAEERNRNPVERVFVPT